MGWRSKKWMSNEEVKVFMERTKKGKPMGTDGSE